MGENFRKGQCENFKKGCDAAMDRMSTPSLFRRPDLQVYCFDADCLRGKTMAIGDALLAQISQDGNTAYLSKGSETVAIIEGDGVTQLRDAIKASDCPDFTELKVISACEISESITVQATI